LIGLGLVPSDGSVVINYNAASLSDLFSMNPRIRTEIAMNRSQPQVRRNFLARIGALAASASMVIVPASLQADPSKAPAAATTGTIKGRLVYAAGPIPTPKVEVKKDDPRVKDAICKVEEHVNRELVIDPATKGVANGFAYLVKPTGDYAATEKELLAKNPQVVFDQVHCEFIPYAAVVHKDQKLIFKSSDPVGHNIRFNSFANGGFNQMVPTNGQLTIPIKKEERRPTPLECSIHPWMTGYFFIVDHPFAVVTKPDGSFEISGVPAGPQQLVVWQGKGGYATEGGNKGMKVEVKAGEVSDVGDVKITKIK